MISPARRLARAAISLAMVAVGALHFVRPEPFVRIMPSALPWPLALVWLSGACEMALGAGFAFERTKRLAGWGLVALFVAVFPANVNMAITRSSSPPAARCRSGRCGRACRCSWCSSGWCCGPASCA